MAVPLFDTTTPLAGLHAEIDAAIASVVAGRRFILGPEVAAFEAEFAAYCGARHAVGVANGTDALTIALRAMGVGPGDDVSCPPSRSTRPPRRSRRPARGRCSATSIPTRTASPPRPSPPR